MQNLINNIFGIQVALAQAATGAEKDPTSINILSYIISHLPLWITAVVVLVMSFFIGILVKGIVENRLASRISDEHQEVLIISGRIAFLSVVVVGITISLAIAGINITSLLAAIGFGISFGLQDTIANFVAGIALLASRPFSIGDWIKVNGKTGKVTEIRTRATYLQTYDGLRLIVPNSQLYKSQVLSYTSNPMRRIKVPAYCRYGVDMKQVKALCLNEVRKNPHIFLEPKPNVIITDLADSYIALEARFWVDAKGPWRRIQSRIFINIQTALEQAGLDAPYAITSLSLEPEIESFAFKTKSLDSNELGNMMNQRMKDEEQFMDRRNEISKAKKQLPKQEFVDQSGTQFLQTTPAQPTVQSAIDPKISPNSANQ